jgi:hypothetical protein
MSSMMTQPEADAHVDGACAGVDSSARSRGPARKDHRRLDRGRARLAELLDPEAFELVFTAVPPLSFVTNGDDEPIPVCRQCGSLVGIFPRPWPALAALPRRRHHVRRPADLRPGPRPRDHLDPPRRGPGRALAK